MSIFFLISGLYHWAPNVIVYITTKQLSKKLILESLLPLK